MTQEGAAQARVRAAGAIVRREVAQLGRALRALDAAGWAAPSWCEGWSVHDVAAHMAESNDRFYQIVAAALAGGRIPDFTPAERAERQAAVKAGSPSALVAQLEERANATFDLLEAASAQDLARTVTVPAGQLTLAQLGPQRLSECALHTWDIRYAWDRQAQLVSDAVPLLLDGVLASVGRLARRGAANAPEATYRLELEGPGGGSVTLQLARGEARAQRGAPERAAVTLRLAAEAGLRLLWGRLDLVAASADGRVQVEGNRELALALTRVFRGV
jgi:uncharacterized protein (TIGR03083 family)